MTKFKCSNCLEMQYDLLTGLYYDKKEETDDYLLCISNIMNDYFWNLAYLKKEATDIVISNLEDKFNDLGFVPCLYLGRNDSSYEYNKKLLLSKGYRLNDTDVYMVLDNYKDVDINLNIKVVENESEYNDYMKVLSSAYNDNIENPDENVYADAITKDYYSSIKKSIGNGKAYHIIGYDGDIPVSVATLSIFNGIGGINNVGTAQGYWNRGYAKQVIAYLVKLFKELNGKDLILCTEYHTKNQTYYEKLGFKEVYVMEQYIK